ncbi:glycosyltransferase [Robertmurraya korlensis]|uniref:glycosyltransferase n=1 Tax=Robertmurraya korlensis TaxID=519977 RepID=UPI0008246505|nr:glycosyltransferase [Robertmurraya korlensis]
MNKGTIVYIGGFELPDKNAAAHRVLNNGKLLRELGYNVVFIGIDKTLKYNVNQTLEKKKVQGFEYWSLPYPSSNVHWMDYLTNTTFFKKIIRSYSDIKTIICYNYQSIPFLKIKNYCKLQNINIIADCTEWYSTSGTNIVFKIIKGLDSFLRMRVIQKKVDGIIVISRYLEDYYRNNKNVLYLPPLVDLLEVKWDTSKFSNDSSRPLIVYAGSPGRNKDKLNLVIEAMSKLRIENQYSFYIVGLTKEQYLNDYPSHGEIIEQLDDSIKFLGRLPHTESLKWVKTADYTMFIREDNRMTRAGFPTKFVESISCGTPVITSDNSDLKEYLNEGYNGYFIKDYLGKFSDIKVIIEQVYREMGQQKIIDNSAFDFRNYVNQTKVFISNL